MAQNFFLSNGKIYSYLITDAKLAKLASNCSIALEFQQLESGVLYTLKYVICIKTFKRR